MSQTGTEIITISILPNILRSKGNWTMECRQLMEHKKYFSSKMIHKM